MSIAPAQGKNDLQSQSDYSVMNNDLPFVLLMGK